MHWKYRKSQKNNGTTTMASARDSLGGCKEIPEKYNFFISAGGLVVSVPCQLSGFGDLVFISKRTLLL